MTTTNYTNANFFDGAHDGFTPNSWFSVDDMTGRVVTSGTGWPAPADHEVDFHGQYVMPGMINCHVHVGADAFHTTDGPDNEATTTMMAIKNLRDAIQAGITYVRNLGTSYDVDIKIRNNHDRYGFPTPGIVAAGRAMSITGGHGDGTDHKDGDSYLVDSPDEMRKATRQAFKNGADCIKVMVTGGVMSKGDDPRDVAFTPEEIGVAIREAHARRRKVAAHAQGTEGIRVALEAGIDSIEHGIYIDESEAEFMVEHHVYLVPTLNAVEAIVVKGPGKIPEHMTRKATEFSQAFYDNMRMAVRKGVPMATGTDAGTPFNDFKEGYWNELDLMVNKIGVSPQDTLYAATKNAAELIGVDADYGTMEPGKFADFIVINENPIADINAIRQDDKQVYQHGERRF